jgi:hypothetical protein
VTITAPQPPVTVRVINTYTAKPGSVTVNKSITGVAAGMHGPVALVVACENGASQRIDIPAGAPGPGSATINGVPSGDDCGVAELEDGSTAAVAVTVTGLPPGLFTLLPAEDRTIDVVDAYSWKPGSLVVTKVIDGPEAARRGAVTLAIACSNGAQASTTYQPGDALTPIVLDNLPAGTTCRLEEPTNGSTNGVGDVTGGAPQTITILPGFMTSAVVRNTFVPVEVLAETVTNGDGLATTGTDARGLTTLGLVLLGLGLFATGGRVLWRTLRRT